VSTFIQRLFGKTKIPKVQPEDILPEELAEPLVKAEIEEPLEPPQLIAAARRLSGYREITTKTHFLRLQPP
jgi:hypothetical protein